MCMEGSDTSRKRVAVVVVGQSDASSSVYLEKLKLEVLVEAVLRPSNAADIAIA